MLTCVKYQKRLGAYMDGELLKRKRVSMERHLSECDSCRAELETLKELGPILNTLVVPPTPTALATRILGEAHERKKKSWIIPIRMRWKPLMFDAWLPRAVTTAALVFGLITGGYMGSTTYQDTRPEQPGTLAEENMAIDRLWSNLYVLGASSRDSIEAVTLAILEEGEGNYVE